MWDEKTVARLSEAHEIEVILTAPERPVVRTPIWVVAVEGALYVRSWKGAGGLWYRRAQRYGVGSISAEGIERAVRFVPIDEPELDAKIDDALLGKYADSPYAAAMTRPPATGTTMRLDPAS